MRILTKAPYICSFLSLLILLQGCSDNKDDFKPLSGGFGFKAKWVGVDSGPGAALYYKTNDSKPTLIWPYLDGSLVNSNDMVLFFGRVPDVQGRLIGGYLFAAQAPGPAAEIYHETLKLWAESNKVDYEKVRRNSGPMSAEQVTNGILVHIGTEENLANPDFLIKWEQVSNMVYEVKSKGTKHEIKELRVVYFKPD